ncbi:MAG: OmpA family protein [Byssovorax sp.]
MQRSTSFCFTALLLPALALVAPGCGHSEEEWQAQLAKYGQLDGEHKAAQAKLAQVTKDLEAEKARVADLEAKLRAAGLDLEETNKKLSSANATVEEQQRALADYKARAHQLELIKARFELLKRKLDELTKLGLAVNVRHNRMVISLPGDVLFDSGRETLRKEGQEILLKVAEIIKNDPSLLNRDYQVAGHTDNKPFAGVFRDNWGLSLMRAREVLIFLVGDKNGALPVAHWSAAGFGDTDPIATNDTNEGRQKNRRCDLIVVPSVEEMLDIKAITQ